MNETRLEITSFDRIAFEGKFSSLQTAQDFHAWWTNQRSLPQGGATMARADKPDYWREKHPLSRVKLMKTQRQLIDKRFEKSCEG